MRFPSRPLRAATLLLAALVDATVYGQQPSAAPPAEAAAAPSTEIVGRVETHDNTVIGIEVPGTTAPAIGDSFEVFLTTPAGERGRVGRGKLTFVKNGVALGRLDEATGELAIGQEVRIQSANAQNAVAADHSSLFIGNDPRFPFVLRVETQGDLTTVRGLGRMPYSAADPTPIMAEFVGISVAGDQPTLRGVLALQPDGERLTKPKLSPLVGLYDSVRDDWQMMLSPQHVISASRPGVAAMRGNDSVSTNDGALTIDSLVAAGNKLEQVLRSNPNTNDQLAALNQMQSDAQAAAARARADLPTDVRATLAATRARLGDDWNQATTTLVGLGERMSKTAPATHSQSSVNPPGLDNADAALYVQVAMAQFWYLNDHRFANRTLQQVELQDARSAPPAPMNASAATRWRSFVNETFLLPIYGPTNVAAAAVTRTPRAPAGAASPPPRATPTGTTPVAPPTSIATSTPKPPTGATPTAPSSPSSPSNTAPVAPPNPADTTPALTMPLNDALAFLWAVGMSPDRISSVLVPTTDPALAWQVVRIERLDGGRILIVNYGGAPDAPNVAAGGTTTTGGSAPPTPPSAPGNTASTGGPNSGGSGGTSTAGTGGAGASSGTPPTGGGPPRTPDTTTLVNNDGANRVPGSPPNVPPPAGPGGPKPPQWAPAPPPPADMRGVQAATTGMAPNIAAVDNPRPADPTGPVPRPTGTPHVYDPNVTVLVNEDSGQAPTPALTQAQINAARAALNRAGARDPSGVMTVAKGPGAANDAPASAAGPTASNVPGAPVKPVEDFSLQPPGGVCHDYVLDRLGLPNPPGSHYRGATDVDNGLNALGYAPATHTGPNDRLPPGTVIQWGTDHVGIIGPDGRVRHFTQAAPSQNRPAAVNTSDTIDDVTRTSHTLTDAGTGQSIERRPYENRPVLIRVPPQNGGTNRLPDWIERGFTSNVTGRRDNIVLHPVQPPSRSGPPLDLASAPATPPGIGIPPTPPPVTWTPAPPPPADMRDVRAATTGQAPHIAAIDNPRPAASTAPVPRPTGTPHVYDPNVTVLVNEDSGQAPTPALTQAQINAARAALNRNMVAGGVQTLAKDPKGTDGDQHHDAPAVPAGPQGFQAGDGAKVDARFADAQVKTHNLPGGTYQTITYHRATGGVQGGVWNQHVENWSIILFPSNTEVQDSLQVLVKANEVYKDRFDSNDDAESFQKIITKKISANSYTFYLHHKTIGKSQYGPRPDEDFTYDRSEIYRDKFVIYYHNLKHISPVVGEDVSRDGERIIAESKKLIDLRFPPEKK